MELTEKIIGVRTRLTWSRDAYVYRFFHANHYNGEYPIENILSAPSHTLISNENSVAYYWMSHDDFVENPEDVKYDYCAVCDVNFLYNRVWPHEHEMKNIEACLGLVEAHVAHPEHDVLITPILDTALDIATYVHPNEGDIEVSHTAADDDLAKLVLLLSAKWPQEIRNKVKQSVINYYSIHKYYA